MINETRGGGGMFNTRTNGASPRLLSVDSLVGNEVHNLEGDDLGGIKDMMLDVHTGHVAYVVLSFGGIFGMGEKLFAVPWNALTLDTKEKRFILNADKEKLKNAPGFDKANWPDMADRTWGDKIHSYYGTKHYSETLR
ncbi:MAG: PRC-barrel domain-containing protein [Gammaproteobacteria bacterium]|nr:PRC-barrel domain-containing protein [Gammaproteobacteria bacterium]MDP2142466.1 PRC-barrel domain-containing protein [Gammaproteobacteria bacterium]MDP2346475.1 PRC-barrel domain-containing protein [Gammaproteobacteria bacterium]